MADPRIQLIKIAILHLTRYEPLSISELSKKLKRSKSNISYHLEHLEDMGLINVVRTKYHGTIEINYYKSTSNLQLLQHLSQSTDASDRVFCEYLLNLGAISFFLGMQSTQDVDKKKVVGNLNTIADKMRSLIKDSEDDDRNIHLSDNYLTFEKFRQMFDSAFDFLPE